LINGITGHCTDENYNMDFDHRIKLTFQWGEDNNEISLNNIDEKELENMFTKLNRYKTLNSNEGDIKHLIDNSIESLSALLITSAINTFPAQKQSKRNLNDKPWFGKECKNKSNNFANKRKEVLKNNNRITKFKMIQAKKEYKRVLNKYRNKFNKNFDNKLRQIKDKDPKYFWSIIKSKKKEPLADISMKCLYEYFKNLNEGNDNEARLHISDCIINNNEEPILNDEITENEIVNVINKLKNNKATGLDGISNEMIKNSSKKIIKLLTYIFNVIFNTGVFPQPWLIGIIKPIYKNKGKKNDPSNYRGITLIICFGKLFTAVLNIRLLKFLDSKEILDENQAGFRPGYSTT